MKDHNMTLGIPMLHTEEVTFLKKIHPIYTHYVLDLIHDEISWIKG